MSDPARHVISPAIVGTDVGPLSQTMDARWLMAYAAGLGETDPRYYDTLHAAGPIAHPLFPVCYEWPVALLSRAKCVDAALAPLGVHATHDAILHRLPRAGDVLLTSARVTAVERRRSGVLVVTRFTTVDHQGAVVTTTDYGSLYRGVELAAGAPGDHHAGREAAGAAREPRPEAPHPASSSSVAWTEPVAISAQASHVYTECARIWNPIHTDVAVAKAAGLDAPILHGTATLALAVSRVIARELAGDPARVRRITVRFTGMVAMPSTIVVRGLGVANGSVAFDAIDAEGRAILAGGRLATTP